MNWSRHRYTDVICLVITTVTVVVALVFINGERWGLQKVTSDAAADRDGNFSARDYDATWSEATAVRIDLDALESLTSGGAYVLDGDVHIVTAGTYVLTGSLRDHQVIVDADEAKVQLVLAGVDLVHQTLAPLTVAAADKVFLTLPADSRNQIAAGNLVSPEASAAGQDAAIYARSDLAINGPGALTVTATGGHGIKSTDDLVVTGGEISVSADNTALLGKDSVRIAAGDFTLSAREGIKANRTGKPKKGYVTIAGGTFRLDVSGDAIQAETALTISGGDFQITTGGGASAAPVHREEGPGGFGGRGDQKPPDGNFAGGPPVGFPDNFLSENTDLQDDFDDFVQKMSSTTAFRPPEEMSADFDDADSDTDGVSRKCLKSGTSLTVSGGTLVLDCYDDAVHTDGDLTMTGGSVTIATGDDGIHADGEVRLDGSSVVIASSYEGIEGAKIYVISGTYDVTSSDDGFNASDGTQTQGFGGRLGEAATVASADLPLLQIDGGTLRVHADGDGLDSNGNLIINGGDIIVDGPSDSGNGALDSGSESGGDLAVHGGVVLALGASGMAETFSENSTQYSLAVNFTSNYTAGEQLLITDAAGSELIRYLLAKSGNSVVFSSPQLQAGGVYTVRAGTQTQTVTQDSISAGESSSGFGGGGQGGFGGGPGRGERGASEGGQRRGGLPPTPPG